MHKETLKEFLASNPVINISDFIEWLESWNVNVKGYKSRATWLALVNKFEKFVASSLISTRK